MKFKQFIFFAETTNLIFISLLYLSFSKKSSIIPLYQIILTENISHLEINNLYNLRLHLKGVGIIIDNNSDVNLIPMHIFSEIYKFYRDNYDDIYAEIEILTNGYHKFRMISSLYQLETVHFILKEFGIIIPLNELFIPTNETEHEYALRFLSKEEQENIIFGKDLIECMEIDYLENDYNFVVNNKSFLIDLEE